MLNHFQSSFYHFGCFVVNPFGGAGGSRYRPRTKKGDCQLAGGYCEDYLPATTPPIFALPRSPAEQAST
jgi:hypothetical protein